MSRRRPLRQLILILVACVIAAPVAKAHRRAVRSEDALTLATREWKALSANLRARQRRDRWEKVIGKLEKLGHGHRPPSERALALYRAGRATEDMSMVSRIRKDARRADALYLEAASLKTSVAVDALEAAAAIEEDRLASPRRAQVTRARARAFARREAPKRVKKAAKSTPSVAVIRTKSDRKALARKAPGRKVPVPSDAEATAAIAQALEADSDLPDSSDPDDDIQGAGVDEPELPLKGATASELRALKKVALADKSISLSEQAGLKIRRIVVDAGHGGKDDGATGPRHTHEKDATLAMAFALSKALKTRGYEVVMTRTKDEFVPLEERTAIANRVHGDLFISIHCNANRSRKFSGVETFALNVASNRFAMRLAARENVTSTRSVSDLRYLLADLATRANTVDSDRFATYVQQTIVSGVARRYSRPKDLGVKHALFYVLLGARMPAVLVETGFISNWREEKHLTTPAYQAIVAESIARAVDRFVARRRQLASAVP